jgi:uncharacterized protein (DUF1919 family)
MRWVITLLLLLSLSNLAGQDKIEYEKRIKRSEFPGVAMNLLEDLPQKAHRFKYYEEHDGDHHSFEVKFKYQSYRYSIEFTPEGALEDIEVTIKYKSLSKKAASCISSSLNDNYDKWRIEKIQIQYPLTNNPSQTLQDALKRDALPYRNHEIIVSTILNGDTVVYEILFDSDGMFKSRRKVIRRSYDFVRF